MGLNIMPQIAIIKTKNDWNNSDNHFVSQHITNWDEVTEEDLTLLKENINYLYTKTRYDSYGNTISYQIIERVEFDSMLIKDILETIKINKKQEEDRLIALRELKNKKYLQRQEQAKIKKQKLYEELKKEFE